MFEDLLKKNSITMKSINLEDEDKEFIKALIKGNRKYNINKPDKDKRPNYLFDIVNNEKNSIDVDKFDYFARDCYYSGAKRLFDFSRLMRLSRIMNDEIVYYYKECYLVYDLFYTRYSLHKTVYKHRTVRAIDYMICDVLEKADHYYNFKSAINERNPEKYMQLSDYIFHEIEHLETDIKEDIMGGIIDCGATLNGANLKHEDPKTIKKNDVSYLLPIVYKEEIVRIYLHTKGNKKESKLEKSFNLIKVAFHSFRKNAKNSGLIEEEEKESSNESEDSNINNGDDNGKKSEIGKKRLSSSNKMSISKKSKK
ncbi:HD phosphohydrolase domain-containing protein [Gigaspora margarita]|uniref:HD phosphohydrolase domain-containing protein n=1 Tax=Gigaspora margarita TaxID=4874 RepID=A0A8H4EH99_GIGMA|nr:HD phosphohydrolase domain-containing protein [Gigaspora margarita]